MGNITIEYIFYVKVSFEMEFFIALMEEVFTKHMGFSVPGKWLLFPWFTLMFAGHRLILAVKDCFTGQF